MSARAEYEAAYFTLLRARDEASALRGYEEFLRAELERLDAFSGAVRDAPDAVSPKLRRPIDATAKSLQEAVGRRRSLALAELAKMPDRVAAAEAFVAECEAEVATLRP